MALISCPACQKQVSSIAVNCPHCGHPIAGSPAYRPGPGPQPTSGGAGWVVLVVLILALAGGGAFFVTQTEAGKKLVAGGGAGGGGNVAPPPVNGGPKSDPQPAFVPPPQVKAETKSIVGRWDVVRSGTQTGSNVAGYMRFNTDGTFTSTLAFLATTDGRYRTMSSTAIELDFPGVIYGRNQVEFLYRLSNDSLSLKDSKLSIDLEFRRVD